MRAQAFPDDSHAVAHQPPDPHGDAMPDDHWLAQHIPQRLDDILDADVVKQLADRAVVTVEHLDELLAARNAALFDHGRHSDRFKAARERYYDALNASSDDVYRQHARPHA